MVTPIRNASPLPSTLHRPQPATRQENEAFGSALAAARSRATPPNDGTERSDCGPAVASMIDEFTGQTGESKSGEWLFLHIASQILRKEMRDAGQDIAGTDPAVLFMSIARLAAINQEAATGSPSDLVQRASAWLGGTA